MATFSGDVQYSQNGTVTNPCFPTLAWIDLHSTLTRNAQSSRAFDNMPGEMAKPLGSMGKPWENHGKKVIYMENHHF